MLQSAFSSEAATSQVRLILTVKPIPIGLWTDRSHWLELWTHWFSRWSDNIPVIWWTFSSAELTLVPDCRASTSSNRQLTFVWHVATAPIWHTDSHDQIQQVTVTLLMLPRWPQMHYSQLGRISCMESFRTCEAGFLRTSCLTYHQTNKSQL